MLLICKVNFSTCFFPYGRVYFGEEGVRRIRNIVDMGDIEGISQRKGFLIDTGTTDDEDFFFVAALSQGCFQ